MAVTTFIVMFVLGAGSVTYAGWTITQLTDNSTDDWDPHISGTNVVWRGWDGSDWEIYSNFAGQLTNNDVDDFEPDISGTNVVWRSFFWVDSENDNHICSNFAGVLTLPAIYHSDNFSPAISGNNVVWVGLYWHPWPTASTWNVFSNFEGQLTYNTSASIWGPRISGNIVVWLEETPTGREVHSNVLEPISAPYGTGVDISGTNVVWMQPYQGKKDIFSNFDGRLTYNLVDDLNPAISGTNVVWQVLDVDGSDWEIYSNFAGQVTDNTTQDTSPAISGTNVVWQGHDGSDWEIYMATYSTNAPPIADAGGPYLGDEGYPVIFDGTGSSDPDGDLLIYAWGFGDGDTGTGATTTHTYANNGTYDVSHTVTDPAGASDTQSTTAEIANVAPMVGPITAAPMDPIQVGTSIFPIAEFEDPGTLDTHTAEWDWGDGSVEPGSVTQGAGFGIVSDPHTYAEAGIYTVRLTVTDDDGGIGESEFQYVVVFDPSAGFVTGGGWIDSPAGAYTADPSLTGKANFGFVSKYKKGAEVPTGQTEFKFEVASLEFHSSSYDWLVVNQGGTNAQFKGAGTINDSGYFKFMLWAGDDPDTFRIKIWEENESGVETVKYDNGFNQAIAGGSIVIHVK